MLPTCARPLALHGNRGKEAKPLGTKPKSSVLLSAGQMSHPSNNNRVMVNEEVAVTKGIVLGVAEASKAQETRPSLPNNCNLRLALPNLLLLLWLPPSTLSSLVTSRPLSSCSLLCCPRHSTQASIKLYL